MDFRWLVLAKPFLPQVNTLKSALEDMEKERDYYFGKLREVELLCQEEGKENTSLVEQLMVILYAADEQVGPRVGLDCFSSLEVVVEVEGLGGRPSLRLCHVWSEKRKTSVFMLSHVTLLRFAEAFMAQFSTFDVQEGAELAEGNGEEAEQQPQEEGGDDQQEEQDEY